jgi:hypothetical protein
MGRAWLRDGIAAGAWAGALGGIPSTVIALARGTDPLEATRAAGTLLLPHDDRDSRLLPAAVLVHGGLSLAWAGVLARTLPPRHTVPAGAAAGLTIGLLDLGLVGRRFPRIRDLPPGPQLADHLAYGAVAGAVIARRRRGRRSPTPVPWSRRAC